MPETTPLESSAIEINTDELESVLNLELEDDMKKHTVKRETHEGLKAYKRTKLLEEQVKYNEIAEVIRNEIREREEELLEVEAVLVGIQANITSLDTSEVEKSNPSTNGQRKTKNGN